MHERAFNNEHSEQISGYAIAAINVKHYIACIDYIFQSKYHSCNYLQVCLVARIQVSSIDRGKRMSGAMKVAGGVVVHVQVW